MTLNEHVKLKKEMLKNIRSVRKLSKSKLITLDAKISLGRQLKALEEIELNHSINIHSLVSDHEWLSD